MAGVEFPSVYCLKSRGLSSVALTHFLSISFACFSGFIQKKRTEKKWKWENLTLIWISEPLECYQSTAWSWMKLIKLSNNIFCDHCGNQIPPWQIIPVTVRPPKCKATTSSHPRPHITMFSTVKQSEAQQLENASHSSRTTAHRSELRKVSRSEVCEVQNAKAKMRLEIFNK